MRRCRVTGTLTCYGVAVYSMVQRATIPEAKVGNRRFMVGFAAVWAALGTYRALM